MDQLRVVDESPGCGYIHVHKFAQVFGFKQLQGGKSDFAVAKLLEQWLRVQLVRLQMAPHVNLVVMGPEHFKLISRAVLK